VDQGEFRISSLPSGDAYSATAFAPNGRHLAAIAQTLSREEQGIKIAEEIQIWDFRQTKLVSEKILSRKKSSPDLPNHGISLFGYAASGSMILLGRDDRLVLLDSATFAEIREISLATGNWPGVSPNFGSSFVKEVAVARSADRAAVLLQWGPGGGGELRVYSLSSGELIRSWDYYSLRKTRDRSAEFGGADISADGRQVAVSVIPFVLGEGILRSAERNVFVLGVDSGATISAMNTVYPAGEVRFSSTATPHLLTVSADNFDRQRSPKDVIKVWDPVSGKLLRELESPQQGTHFQVQVSSDGQTVLGYTGAEKFRGRWWLGQEEYGFAEYDQFTLWDLATGKIKTSSPRMPSSDVPRNFRLSPDGDMVLVNSETAAGKTLMFYTLQHSAKTARNADSVVRRGETN
jgi:WD40 repeat protein